MRKNALLLGLLLVMSCSPAREDRPATAKSGQQAPALELKKLINCGKKEIGGWQDFKDKAVVLEFWATWCGPSVEELGHFNGLVEKFSGKPVVFISVTDESQAVVRAFMKEHEIKGCVAAEAPASVFQGFRVYGRPHMVLVDKTSKVAALTSPGKVGEEAITALIEGRAPLEAQALQAQGGADSSSALAEFFISGSAKKTGQAAYGRAYVSAEAMPLSSVLEVLFKADKIEPDKLSRDLLAALYDLRVRLPPEKAGEYRDFLSRGLDAALGLKFRLVEKKAEVYVLKRTAGAIKGFDKRNAGRGESSSQEGSVLTVDGLGLDALCGALKARLGAPVVNEAGLKGGYLYSFDFKDGTYKTIAAELPAQLGLRLDKGVRKVTVLEVSARAPR